MKRGSKPPSKVEKCGQLVLYVKRSLMLRAKWLNPSIILNSIPLTLLPITSSRGAWGTYSKAQINPEKMVFCICRRGTWLWLGVTCPIHAYEGSKPWSLFSPMLQHHLGCRVPSPNLLHLAGMMKHSDTRRRRAQQNPIRPSAQCCTDKSPAKATLSSSRCKGMLNQDNARHHHWQFRNFSTPLNIQNIWHKFQKAFHLAFQNMVAVFFKVLQYVGNTF